MKKNLLTIILIIVGILLAVGAIYSYKQANTMVLQGEVEVKTKLGEGTTFIVRLPLTLAIIQALMVVVGGEKYAISLGSIQTIEDISIRD